MRQISFIVMFFFFLSLAKGQTQSLDDYFIMGLKSQLQLNQETRKALLNGYKTGKGSSLKMQNGGTASVLEYKENNYLKIRTSEEGYFSLKRWVDDKGVMFGLSWWVCGSQCDGYAKLVRPSVLQQTDSLPVIRLSDFFNEDSLKADGLTKEMMSERFEIDFIHYEFSSGDTIWVYNNTHEYLDELRQKKYQKYWKGNALPIIRRKGIYIKGEVINKSFVLNNKKDE